MAPHPSRQDAEDFICAWLSGHFGYRPESIHPDHVLPVDLGVAGVHGDLLLGALHERFGTDFSELDADAGFGIEDRSPSGLIVTTVSFLDRTVHGPPDDEGKTDADGEAVTDEWQDAWVRVGDLIDAVHRGRWIPGTAHRRHRDRPPGAPALDPGKPVASALGALGKVSGRAFAEHLRSRISRPATLPDRAPHLPASGFRRDPVARCAWCDRHELIYLDERFDLYDMTCLACGKDSTMTWFTRWMVRLPTVFGLHMLFIVLFGGSALVYLAGHELIALGSLPVTLGILFFLSTGVGQFRRLPGGAKPKHPSPTRPPRP